MASPTITMKETPLGQNDRAVLDFVKSLKASEGRARMPIIRKEFETLAPEWSEKTGRRPATIADVADVMRDAVAYKFDRALSRFSQELMYSRVHAHMAGMREELRAFLDAPTPNALGSVRVNPNLKVPAYFDADYHVQPGGMDREELIGFITNVTQKVYFGGNNDGFEMQHATAAAIPDGNWERMLDIGCGSKSAFAIKQRFPNAEVHGLDLSAPLIKFAHKQAEAMGLAIHFSQQDAADTDFPDNHFDVVSSCIIFHEMPDDHAQKVITEGYRILKPGGWFVIADAAPYRAMDLFAQFFTDWQTDNNVEPYWRQAGLRDLPAMMRRAGFHHVWDPMTDGPVKGRVFPWVTKGQK